MAEYEVLEPGGHACLVNNMKDYADRVGGTGTAQLADKSVTSAKLGDDVTATLLQLRHELDVLDEWLRQEMVEVPDWHLIADAVADEAAEADFPVGTRFSADWVDTHGSSDVTYEAGYDVMHHTTGVLEDESEIPVMYLQWHWTLPFDTQFSPSQAFLMAPDGLPAGTYNVTVDTDMYNRAAGTYQWTLTQALPAGGQMVGFFAGGQPSNIITYPSASSTTSIETCAVTEGSDGTSLGTFSNAGISVPASGTPETTVTLTIGGSDYEVYALNSVQRVSWGNNRWLHSPLRQWLNASGADWFVPQTVFDRPPAYVAYEGFLTGLPADLVAAMRPVRQVTALNYISDGGTVANPLYDETYDKVFLPSGEQHWINPIDYYGGSAGLEGDGWEYWHQAYGLDTKPSWGATVAAYRQYDINAKTTARNVWMRSAPRAFAYAVTYVYTSGYCGSSLASYGSRVAPACAIG